LEKQKNDIFSWDQTVLQEKLKNGEIHVCVIGIGRIGLPTAISFAKANLPTIGVDINSELVEKVNSGIFPLKDEPGYEEIFEKVIQNGNLKATTDLKKALDVSDVILLSLPTPMDENNVPNYSAITNVCKNLSNEMNPNSLIVIESTIEPGFVENELIYLLESNKKLKINGNFSIGVCPENANPGEILHDFTNLPRLIGGYNDKTLDLIHSIYSYVFPVEFLKMSNCKTANAVKLTTNVFRDLNIAFVNELAQLYEKLGIDVYEVLNAAQKKYNFQIHYPGPGVGGPCLPVNSYQLINSARGINSDLKLVQTGRKINEDMPNHSVLLLQDGLNEINKEITNSTILVLGISYKANVKDIQISPAKEIIDLLKKEHVNVKIFDPYYLNSVEYGIKTEASLDEAINDIDGIMIVTAHKEFLDIGSRFNINDKKKIVIVDSRGIINQQEVKKAGVIYRGIGRGNSLKWR
jgi:nucleotide sugar dehydrogenase